MPSLYTTVDQTCQTVKIQRRLESRFFVSLVYTVNFAPLVCTFELERRLR